MKRRDFLTLTCAAGLSATFSRVALAQQSSKPPRVVLLMTTPIPELVLPFYEGLADYGFVDGKNIVVERYTAPTQSDLAAFAALAVASKPDIIWTSGTAASVAAREATNAIPVVFTGVSDPIGVGLIASLARPGGNVTGNSNGGPDLDGKKISILKEALPTLTRLAVPLVPSDPQSPLVTARVREATKVLGLEPVFVEFLDGQDFALQFQRIVAAAAQAVYTPQFSYFNLVSVRDLHFDLLVRNKLPSIGGSVTPGAATPFYSLISYAASVPHLLRQSSALVDAILKGAKPGDLPVQLPTIFDLAVNLDTARKIGVTIPTSILAQATLVIDYDIRATKAPN